MNKLNSFMNKQMELCFNQRKKQKKQNKKQKKKRVCNIYFWPACKVIKLKEEDVTLSTSLFMFHPIFLSPHFFVHVSLLFPSVHISLFMFHCYFLQSTVHPIHLPYFPYLVVFILHGHLISWSISLFSQSLLWKLTTYQCL